MNTLSCIVVILTCALVATWVSSLFSYNAKRDFDNGLLSESQYEKIRVTTITQSVIIFVLFAALCTFIVFFPWQESETTFTIPGDSSETTITIKENSAEYSVTIFLNNGDEKVFNNAKYVDAKDGGIFFIDERGRECSYWNLEYEVIEEMD